MRLNNQEAEELQDACKLLHEAVAALTDARLSSSAVGITAHIAEGIRLSSEAGVLALGAMSAFANRLSPPAAAGAKEQ